MPTLTPEYGVLAFWTFGSAWKDTWLLGSVRFIVSPPWNAAQELIEKKKHWNYEGTWESNPGPKDCMTRSPPLHHLRVFVNIMEKKYNIQKRVYMLEKQKRRA